LNTIDHPKLEVSEDIPFQRMWWSIQRIGWAIMGLILIASLGGTFGDGPLSKVRLSSSSGQVEFSFNRVVRRSSPEQIAIQVRRVQDSPIILRIPREFLEHAKLEEMSPPPFLTEADGDGRSYHFRQSADGDGIWLLLDLEYQRAGTSSGLFGVGKEEILVSQFVLP